MTVPQPQVQQPDMAAIIAAAVAAEVAKFRPTSIAQGDRSREVHPVDPENCPDTRDGAAYSRRDRAVTLTLEVNPDSTIDSSSGKSFKLGTGGGKISGAPAGQTWRYSITVTRDKKSKSKDSQEDVD